VLIILSGLPGVGKTTIAREIVWTMVATHVRVDSIEQALRGAGIEVRDEGYRVAYAIAEDNLRLGQIVVADSVNPWSLTRNDWRAVATRANVPRLDVEVVCSDTEEHRRRVESRTGDLPDHTQPTWQQVLARDYHPWDRERLVVDTSLLTVEQAAQAILAEVPAGPNFRGRRDAL
jgi:predicted kinase